MVGGGGGMIYIYIPIGILSPPAHSSGVGNQKAR